MEPLGSGTYPASVAHRAAQGLFDSLELLLDVVLAPLSLPLEALFLVPTVGTILFYAYKAAVSLFWRLVSLPDLLLGLTGILVPRRAAVRMVILPKAGVPVVPPETAEARLREAAGILWKRARLRLEPIRFAWDLRPPMPLVVVSRIEPGPAVRRPPCGIQAFKEDFGRQTAGPWFRAYMFREAWASLPGAARRLLGLGRPLYVFVVEDVMGAGGCSLGPLADYVVVGPDCGGLTIAHEIGHACGLWHTQRPDNLMKPLHSKGVLDPWQTAVLRSSEHATLL